MSNFKPQGGQEVKQTKGEGLNYRAVFTGVVDATPVKFNPTKEDLAEIKGIPIEKLNEPVYVGVFERDNVKQTKLNLLVKINPNELLCKDKDGNINKLYKDDHFFDISLTISAEDEISKDKDEAGRPKTPKFRFINESLQTIWAESIDAIKANPKLDWFKTETARVAKKGEIMLYTLLGALYKNVGTKENPITDFKLGNNPTDTFLDIVNGDVSSLNDLITKGTGAYEYFSHDDGSIRKVAVMLGVKESNKTDDNGNHMYNQVVFVNNFVNSSFAKEGRSLSKDAVEAIKGDKFKASIQGSLKFQLFDPVAAMEQTLKNLTDVESTSIDNSNISEDDYEAVYTSTDF